MPGRYLLNEEEPELLGQLTPGTSQQVAPAPVPQPPATPLAPQPMAPPAMKTVPPLPMTPQAPQPKLPGMPQGITPQEIEGYLSAQKESLNRYGPEAQLEQQADNDDRRNSFAYKATSGLKGFADALMSGVARAGNPNWQGQFIDQENHIMKEKMDALKGADEGNLRRTSTDMNIDRMNPGSVLSKTSQDVYAPLFEKLGYPAETLKGMSASNIDNAVSLMAQFGGKQVEAMIKRYEAEVAGAQFEETRRHNRSVEGSQAQDDQRSAAAELLKHGGDNKTVMGVPIPFTRANTDQTEAAKKVLEGQMGSSTPAPEFKTEAEAAAAGLADGTPVVIGGVKGKWKN